jgi:hypothetical protein
MRHSWTKSAFWDVNNKKWRKRCKFVSAFLSNNSYGLPVLTKDTKCPNQVFYVWLVDLQTICAKYDLETRFLQMTLFVNICSPWSMLELETLFWTWKTRNDLNGVSLFHLSYLITLMVYLCSQWKPKIQIKYFNVDWSIHGLFVLRIGWKNDSLQIKIFVHVTSTWSIVELKTRYETWITRNYVNGVSFFHLSYLITLMASLCSQWTPNDLINFIMFDWSIYRLFVLNKGWKHDSQQIMIFVYACSTWDIVELKTRFETWITRNVLNSISLFTFLILLKLWLTCAHNGHQMSKSSIFCLIGRSTD